MEEEISEADELKQAVTDYIKSEYAFRLGPYAYQKVVEDHFLEAEANLRRILTGSPYLSEAAKVLGVKVLEEKAEVKRKVKYEGQKSVLQFTPPPPKELVEEMGELLKSSVKEDTLTQVERDRYEKELVGTFPLPVRPRPKIIEDVDEDDGPIPPRDFQAKGNKPKVKGFFS